MTDHPAVVSADQSEARAVPADTASRPSARAMLLASIRLGAGSAMLLGTGLARLVETAAGADVTAAAPARDGAGGRPRQVSSGIVGATGQCADKMGRAVIAAARTAPAGVRDPIARRLSSWSELGREERNRSRATAAVSLDFAAGFLTDWVVERLDVNRIVERLRLDEIIAGLELTDVILSSSGGVTGHVLDKARARVVGADALVDRAVGRARHFHASQGEQGPVAATPLAPA